jgi:hypothetical protein
MMEKYIHKPGCPSPWMCNCSPTVSEEVPMVIVPTTELPWHRDEKAQDHLHQLANTLRWLGERDDQCQQCINHCLRELVKPTMPLLDDVGHYPWMCEDCKNLLDMEGEQALAELTATMVKAMKAPAPSEEADNLYHIARLAYVLGEEEVSWWRVVVNVLRAALGFHTTSTPAICYNEQVKELHDRLKRARP